MLEEERDSVTNRQLLDEIIKSRDSLKVEFKSIIEDSENRLRQQLEETNKRINILEKENSELKLKLKQIESSNRRKSIVIFGLKRPEKVDPKFVCNKLNNLIDNISLIESDIGDLRSLGINETSPLKVEFTNYFKKITVLRNSYKLKGSGVSISNDYSPEQRNIYKTLKKHLALATLEGNNKECYIKNYKLYIDGKSYTVEDLGSTDLCAVGSESNSRNSSPSAERAIDKITAAEKIPTDQVVETHGTKKKPSKEIKEITPLAKSLRTRAGPHKN